MKRYILFLLISLFTFSNCSKEDDIIKDEIPPYEETDPNTDFNGFKVENSEGIDKSSLDFWFINDTTFISGLKNRKLWIGCFDSNTKVQLKEWNGTKQILDPLTKIRGQYFRFVKGQNKYVGYINLCDNEYQIKSSLLISLNETDDKITYVSELEDNYLDINNIELYDDMIYIKSKDSYGIILGDLYSLDSNSKITSTTKYIQGDSTFFIGFNDEKIQFRLYNEMTKELKKMWNTKEPFDRNIKIYEGYGEYRDFYVNAINLTSTYMPTSEPSIVSTSWGIALIPYYVQDVNNFNCITDVFLLKDDNNDAIRYRFKEAKSGYASVQKWYDDTILVGISNGISGGDYLVITPDGDLIKEFSLFSYTPEHNTIYPISYTEVIYIGKMDTRPHYDPSTYVMRLDYTKDISFNGSGSIWYTKIEGVKDDNGRKLINLIDNKSINWIYELEIISYNGDKQIIKFSVDINTGEVKYL